MRNSIKNLPTPADAKLFDDFVKKWQAKLSLGDWRIERGTKPAKSAMASVEFNPAARLCTYRLGDFGAEQITQKSLEATVIHELLHVLLFDLINTASDKSTDEELEAAEHRVINVLEQILRGD
jgi:hypothetical protein